jgi:hypothetical protein
MRRAEYIFGKNQGNTAGSSIISSSGKIASAEKRHGKKITGLLSEALSTLRLRSVERSG